MKGKWKTIEQVHKKMLYSTGLSVCHWGCVGQWVVMWGSADFLRVQKIVWKLGSLGIYFSKIASETIITSQISVHSLYFHWSYDKKCRRRCGIQISGRFTNMRGFWEGEGIAIIVPIMEGIPYVYRVPKTCPAIPNLFHPRKLTQPTCPLKRDYFNRKYIHLPTIYFQGLC